jgi:hypothetical protein
VFSGLQAFKTKQDGRLAEGAEGASLLRFHGSGEFLNSLSIISLTALEQNLSFLILNMLNV